MKYILARIESIGSKCNYDCPTPDDMAELKKIVGDTPASGMAWQLMRRRGWIHDGWNNNQSNDYLIWKFPETAVEKLELKLKFHNWAFEFADDYGSWNAGKNEELEIKSLMQLVGEPLASEMHDRYNPFKKENNG